MNRQIFVAPLFLFLGLVVRGQSGELNVGEKVPANLQLGNVTNNHTGKARFSEFRGKLVILDFWNTSCVTCIKNFPKLEELQTQFGDRIQIFLVNIQSQEEIDKKFTNLYKKGFRLPNLPSIVGDSVLSELFPHKYLGHNVWIDANGIVRLRSSSINESEEKIQAVLEGKPISFLRDDVVYDRSIPLYVLAGKTNETKDVNFMSFFMSFSEQLGEIGGAVHRNIIDTAGGTIRNTYLNREVIEYYKQALSSELNMSFDKILNEEKRVRRHYPLLILDVPDSSKYTSAYITKSDMTDHLWVRSRFCYEQVLPISARKDMDKYLFQDLNRFFGSLYGTEVRVEKIKVKCHLLVRTSAIDKLYTKRNGLGASINDYVKGGKKIIKRTNYNFRQVLSSMIAKAFPNGFPGLLVDETGYNGKVDIEYPGDITGIEDLVRILEWYDLTIREGETELNMLVIKERLAK